MGRGVFMLKEGEENNVLNIKPREVEIEKSVLQAIDKMEASINLIQTSEEDMQWDIVKDYSNPTKEEVNKQLSTIPTVQAYYNNIKVYAELLLDLAEHELYVAQVNAREAYSKVHKERLASYETQIVTSMQTALRSTNQDKAFAVIKDMVRNMKPKEPTEKEIESYIKGQTAQLEKKVVVLKYRVNKLRSFCKVLENKFIAARALRYSIDGLNKADSNVANSN